MTILLFLLILLILILVHELGHFIAAKKFGIRVDEFGIGFPPKLFGFKKGETEYTFNLFPIGGFVRIFGENPDEESLADERSMVNKPKWVQAIVLVAGVTFNVIFAWLIFFGIFMMGMPAAVTESNIEQVSNVKLIVAGILPDSPAEKAGFEVGDSIKSLSYLNEIVSDPAPQDVPDFITSHSNNEIGIIYNRGGEELSTNITPSDGIIGVELAQVGTIKLGFFGALYESIFFTWKMLAAIAVGLSSFLGSALLLQADLSQVAGPVGIVSLVGDASSLGFVSLLSFMAIISLDLAIINLLPFPALDGGRLLFVIVEKIKGSPIRPSIVNGLNTVGFALLILLMLVVTYSDVIGLFN